jgi:dGTPase
VAYSSHDTERWAAEPPKRAGRTDFQRDRARVLHSSALRRLAAKTQVVQVGTSDFPRTRLTHSLECAQIGRELGAALGCDPDLVDAACLAHDLGHPPFGHNGETALASLADTGGALACGGFEGNAQSLRLLTRLEPKVPGAGLNLTRATLDAALKYPHPGSGTGKYGAYQSDIAVFDWIRSGAPPGRPCLEAQVMDWADDVAYSVHDVEDGLYAGLVTLKNLQDSSERTVVSRVARTAYCPASWDVSAAELEAVFAEFMELPCWRFSFDGGPESLAAAKNLTSELVGRFCQAAEEATLAGGLPVLSRYAADLVVPRRQLLECALLKAVAAHYVMSREGVAAQQARERELITELALAIERGAPSTLDAVFRPSWNDAASDEARRRVIIDQVASLTDTSAMVWHQRLALSTGGTHDDIRDRGRRPGRRQSRGDAARRGLHRRDRAVRRRVRGALRAAAAVQGLPARQEAAGVGLRAPRRVVRGELGRPAHRRQRRGDRAADAHGDRRGRHAALRQAAARHRRRAPAARHPRRGP